MLNKIFKIILLENNQEDTELISDALRKSKVNHELIIVSDKESYTKALIEHQPDLILAEALIPSIEMNEAMELCLEYSPNSSLILLTVSLDRELSVHELIKEPHKYLELQRTTKLNAAIKTSLDILNTSEELKRMDRELKGREALLTATLESTADGILVVDNDGEIVSYNQNFIKMWDIPLEIMESKEGDRALTYVLNQLKEPEAFLQRVHELYSEPDAVSYDKLCFKDGKIFERYSKPQKIDGKTVGRVWSFRDITDNVKKDEQLKESLKEKELMLREIHHRVKNNLQIISSLLKLQSINSKDPDAIAQLQNSQNRVRTMGMIHEKLYGSKELNHIDFGAYVKQLVAHLFSSYGVKPNTIQLVVNAKNVFLDIDTAVPCGLIINELVSNCLKHAFPDCEKGHIEIEFFTDKDEYYNLIVSDDGIGLPEEAQPSTSDSLGLKLISTLSRQLGSEMEINVNNGTRYFLKFPPVVYSERK